MGCVQEESPRIAGSLSEGKRAASFVASGTLFRFVSASEKHHSELRVSLGFFLSQERVLNLAVNVTERPKEQCYI